MFAHAIGPKRPPSLTAWLLGAALSLVGCRDAREADRAALREILAEDRRAHLETDPERIGAHLADSVITVDGGRIRQLSRDEIVEMFYADFEGAEYHAWDDVEEPILRVSGDGSMAWVARRVTVDRGEPGASAVLRRRRFESAWTATYAKRGGAWWMTSVTSTFAPEPAVVDRILAAARSAMGLGEPETWPFRGIRAVAIARRPGGLSFGVTVLSARDGRVRIAFDPGLVAALLPGEEWVAQAAGDLRSAPSPEMRTFIRGHEVHMNLLAPDSRFEPLRYTGRTPFEGVEALRLTGLDELDGPVELYYSAVDTLPLGYQVQDHARSPDLPVRLVVVQWMRSDGVLVPSRASFRQGDERYVYEFTLLELMSDAPDSLFRMP